MYNWALMTVVGWPWIHQVPTQTLSLCSSAGWGEKIRNSVIAKSNTLTLEENVNVLLCCLRELIKLSLPIYASNMLYNHIYETRFKRKGRRKKKSANYASTIWLKKNYSPAQSETTDMTAALFWSILIWFTASQQKAVNQSPLSAKEIWPPGLGSYHVWNPEPKYYSLTD